MAVERRKDNKNRVLKEGEYQRSSGTYEFKWRDKRGGRHSIRDVYKRQTYNRYNGWGY